MVPMVNREAIRVRKPNTNKNPANSSAPLPAYTKNSPEDDLKASHCWYSFILPASKKFPSVKDEE